MISDEKVGRLARPIMIHLSIAGASTMALDLDPPFDAADYLTDQASQAELINDALETGDHGYIAAALGVVARARGMAAVAEQTGLKRQTLYKALDEAGNPTLETFAKVVGALGLKLAVTPIDQPTGRVLA